MEGMPLGDVIRIISMEEPDVEISLGAASGYVAIDTAARLIPQLDKISGNVLLSHHQIRDHNFEHIFSAVTKAGGICPENKSMKSYINAMVLAETRIRRFVPFAMRPVTEIRPRIRGGIAVFVEGDEVGEFWVKKNE